MDPSPPKTKKSTKHRPFYEASKKTSAEIISEARSSVRSLGTKRPFTPAESTRTLFGSNGQYRQNRPPSACSIASSYTDSRPPTGKRLSPIQNVPDFKEISSYFNSDQENVTFDQDDPNNNNSNNNAPTLKSSIVPKPPQSSEPKFSKTNRRPVVQRRITAPGDLLEAETRRIHSGPKERMPLTEDLSSLRRSSSFGDVSNSSNAQEKSVLCFEETVRPLLKQMELNHLHGDMDSLLVNFDVLWRTLKTGNMLGKSKLGSKRRSELLTSVFKCTSDHNAVLLLKLSRLFIALEVTGKNLEVVCKLLFKVGRNKKHDTLFVEEKLIEPLLLLMEKPQQMDLVDCLVYLTGALKFLSLNEIVQAELIKHGVLKTISNLLQYSIDELTNDAARNKESCHMLVQVTSALSNFANNNSLFKEFIFYNILEKLLTLTETRFKDSEYFLNVSKIFSKLTTSLEACNVLHNFKKGYKTLLEGLKTHYKKQETTVRFCYAFGNIADHVKESQIVVGIKLDGINIFTQIAIYYLNLIEKNNKENNKEGQSHSEAVIIKVVRVIANLSLSEDCGEAFANTSKCVDILLRILVKAVELHLSDELIINTTATINNISFFAKQKSTLMQKQQEFAKAFFKILLHENMECVLEAVRVLGNLTQSKYVRELVVKNEVFKVFITLLDSRDPEVIFCTCGVLVNMMVDVSTRNLLSKFNAISKLIDILKDLAESDWLLAGMVCQILWNYSEKIKTSLSCFGENETDELITVLNELLEPELSLDYDGRPEVGDESIEFLKESWEEHFQPVGVMLLNRIEKHHSELEPIISEPD